MGTVHDDPLELVPARHDEWVEAFIDERDRLRDLLDEHALWSAVERIHHVGSTAVPNLASKDIVDIDLVVDDDVVFEVARTVETELGGTRAENDAGWQPIFRTVDGQRYNVHVFGVEANGWRVSVVTRDVLRSQPELRREYERLKHRLIDQHDSLEAYSVGKSAFMEDLLAVARADDELTYDFEIPTPE